MWNTKFIPLLLRLNGFEDELVSDIPVYKHGEVQPLSIEEWSKGFQRMQRAIPITPKVANALLNRLQIPFQVPEDMGQEDLKELLLLAGLEIKDGEGTSGTGESQSGGAASAVNSENAA